MGKTRSENSLLTKLEQMEIGQEIFVKKTSGFVSDAINTVVSKFKNRKYKQLTLYTHEGKDFTSLKDFVKIICICRVK
jgi:hypothetical protein